MRSPVLAVCFSDLHLSLKPPIARAEERSWLKAMERALAQIARLASEHSAVILCAGDLFDRWNSPAELINWAISNLPHPIYAIPGNHDLPMHQPELIERSAYWTLVKAGVVVNLDRNNPFGIPAHHRSLFLYARPFNGKVPQRAEDSTALHVLLTHEYLWVPDHSYPGAADEHRLSKRSQAFSAFDVVVVGDNHQGFLRKLKSGTRVLNCGTVLRRKSNEAPYIPHVGLIHADGRVTRVALDIEKDVMTVLDPKVEDRDEGISTFVEELAGLEPSSLNFREALQQAMLSKKIGKKVKLYLLEALDAST